MIASPRLGTLALASFASLAALLFTSRAARADDSTRAAPPATPAAAVAAPAPRATEWYGWQTLLVDGASAGILYIGARTDSTPLVLGSVATYALGAPAVHLAHDRPATMGIDVALRVGLPFTFAALGYVVGDKSHPPCTGFICISFSQAENFALGGFLLGLGTAVVFDAAVLAREPSALARPARDTARAPKLRWTPTAALTRGGATAGVVGAF